MLDTCPILECKITSINKYITCVYCDFSACTECCKKFLLQESIPKCMNCNKIWNDEFVDKNFPFQFRNKELKIHNENIIFEREKSMMPETMNILNREIKIKKLQDKIDRYHQKIDRYRAKISELKNNSQTISEKITKIEIIRQCPNTDCNGYLNAKYVCGICDTKVCSNCENIEDDEHECDEDDVKTVIMKRKECKFCPNCSKETYRDTGCSQVWCPPPCNNGIGTPWNFVTGKIENGPIHAPLYYEYMRKLNGGVVPVQNQCENRNFLPSIAYIPVTRLNDLEFSKLGEIHRFTTHIKETEMPKYRNNQNQFAKNLDLRKKYLKNELDDKKFKNMLFMREKKYKKNINIMDNLDMFYNVSYDIFEKFIKDTSINFDDTLKEFEALRLYYNNIMKKTKERFKSNALVVSRINENWVFTK